MPCPLRQAMMMGKNVYANGAVDAPLQCPHGGRYGGGAHAWRCGPSVLRTSLCGLEQGSGRDLTRLTQCTRAMYTRVLSTKRCC